MKILKFNESYENRQNLENYYDGFFAVYMDDWCGFYNNNELIQQGHSFDELDFFVSCRDLKIEIYTICILYLSPTEEQTDMYLQSLPENFKELKKIILDNDIKYEITIR